jgi:hypothetical protein
MVRLAHDEPSIPLKDREGTISTPFRKIFAIICLSPVSLRAVVVVTSIKDTSSHSYKEDYQIKAQVE